MKFCTKCGMGMDDSATVCINCGAKLGAEGIVEQPSLTNSQEVEVKAEASPKKKKKFPIWIPIVGGGIGIIGVLVIAAIVLVVAIMAGGTRGGSGGKEKESHIVGNNGNTGNDNDNANNSNSGTTNDLPDFLRGPDLPEDVKSYVFYDTDKTPVDIQYPEESINPQEIYDSLTYKPEMFFGNYIMTDTFDDNEKINTLKEYSPYITGLDLGYSEDDYRSDYIHYILPSCLEAGPHTVEERLYEQTGLYWASVGSFFGYYTVEGNKFILTPVINLDYDNNLNKYVFTPTDMKIEYEFEFSGPYLVLKYEEYYVTLLAEGFHEPSKEYTYQSTVSVDAYLNYDSEIWIKGIREISIYEDNDGEIIMWVSDLDGHTDHEANAEYKSDGTFTLTWTNAEGEVKAFQCVCIFCGKDGLIFTDGNTSIYYQYDFMDYDEIFIEDNVSGDVDLDNVDSEAIKDAIEKKANLLKDLAAAYEAEGMNVDIDENSGEITLDSTVLFDVNEYEISSEGKTFLSKFIKIYCDVVFDEKYADFVSNIMVDGHTDTNGSYEKNLTLSQNRADSVKKFCISDEAGISSEYKSELAKTMIAAGYSYDKPIYDENGDVDMDASRRVSFRFLINLG